MRRQNLCPGFGLPVAGSPGTPFFSFFPFYSSFFFLFWPSKMEKSRATAASGRGGAESNCVVDSSGNKKTTQPKTTFSFFSSFFFFFFYFGRRKWRNPEQLRCRGEAELLRRQSRIVGEKEDHPTQNKVVLGWCDFFFKIKTPQNDVVLGLLFFFKSEHPKRRRFEVFYFFIFKNDKPKTASFWASSNQNDAVLGCLSLKPYKTPSFSDFIPKPFKNTLKPGLKREEEEDSKRFFFFHFSYFCCEKNSYKSRETFLEQY